MCYATGVRISVWCYHQNLVNKMINQHQNNIRNNKLNPKNPNILYTSIKKGLCLSESHARRFRKEPWRELPLILSAQSKVASRCDKCPAQEGLSCWYRQCQCDAVALYLGRADADRLTKNDPGDTLQKWGCGQRAIIRPVIQGRWQQDFGVKACECCLLALEMWKSHKRLSDPWINLQQPPAVWNDCKQFSTLNLMDSTASRIFCKLGLAEPIWEQGEGTCSHTCTLTSTNTSRCWEVYLFFIKHIWLMVPSGTLQPRQDHQAGRQHHQNWGIWCSSVPSEAVNEEKEELASKFFKVPVS